MLGVDENDLSMGRAELDFFAHVADSDLSDGEGGFAYLPDQSPTAILSRLRHPRQPRPHRQRSFRYRMMYNPPIVTKAEAEGKLRAAEAIRQVGNGRYEANNFAASISEYEKAMRTLRFYASTDEMEARRLAELAVCFSNTAQSCLASKQWERAVKAASAALCRGGPCPKALYRRAMAHYQRKEYAKAQSDLVAAQVLAPAQAQVGRLLMRVSAERGARRDRRARLRLQASIAPPTITAAAGDESGGGAVGPRSEACAAGRKTSPAAAVAVAATGDQAAATNPAAAARQPSSRTRKRKLEEESQTP
jgi:tetratricopeptide (TPR) repeat protein